MENLTRQGNAQGAENFIRYKGKGEHSVNELEKIIEQREEELHQLKAKPMSFFESSVEGNHTPGILETPRPAMMIVGSDQYGRDFQEDVIVKGIGVVCTAKGKTKEEAQANAQRIAKVWNMNDGLIQAVKDEKAEYDELIELSSYDNLTDKAKSRFDKLSDLLKQVGHK